MNRLLFEKTGNAVWISHLDLMRLFQRAFKRAGLPLRHTQGFSPRPSVSIALPLSVGVESVCELLDFELEGESVPAAEIMARLNGALVDGVTVLRVYDGGRKIRDLALMDCVVTLEYDGGVPNGTEEAIQALFFREMLPVEKRTKGGMTEQDIIPLLRELTVCRKDGHTLEIQACICCQNPTLNPMQIAAAVEKYLPELRPDFAKCRRCEIYDRDKTVFR